MTYQKTYGIKKMYDGRFAVCTNISDDKKYRDVSSLIYKKEKNAMAAAEKFIRSCHKNFKRGNEKISFEFKNMGLVD